MMVKEKRIGMAGHNDGMILHGVCVMGQDAAIHLLKCTALPVDIGCYKLVAPC